MPAHSKRDPVMEAEVLLRMSQGEPLAVIAREKGFTPKAWADWCNEDEGLKVAHGRAREDGHDALAAQCIEIADDERHDWLMSAKGEVTNEVAIARAKLRVETRLKLLACWDPRRYGNKVQQEISGPEGGPVQTQGTPSKEAMLEFAAMLAEAQRENGG